MVCYVLGANPPLHAIDGFVKCIWNPIDIDKVGTVAKGVFLVRLKSQEALTVACDSNGILFDKKPFIVKPLTKNVSYEKESITSIPIWVKFPGLSMHYWGARSLNLIAGMLGRVIRIENATQNKDRV